MVFLKCAGFLITNSCKQHYVTTISLDRIIQDIASSYNHHIRWSN